jgi:hypothetical protein
VSGQDGDRAAVDAVLLRAGLKVIPEEYERLVRNYPIIQSQLAALRIPEVRYGEPAVIYSASTD